MSAAALILFIPRCVQPSSASAAGAKPRLAGQEAAVTRVRLDAGDQAGATVIGAAVVDEATVGGELDRAADTIRADEDDTRDLVRDHSREQTTRARRDMPTLEERCLRRAAPAAASHGAAATRVHEHHAELRARLGDVERGAATTSVLVDGDATAVGHAEMLCETASQHVIRSFRPLERTQLLRGGRPGGARQQDFQRGAIRTRCFASPFSSRQKTKASP